MEIQIISGFLGAGKTTFLNQYLPILEGNTVIIENEFGDTGLDGELIQHENIPVHEILAGCICCSLALDFRNGVREISERYHPDRIIIEPSGVGRLSDIIKACNKARDKDGINLNITKLITIVDIASFEEYADGFGAFYLDQIQNARLIFLSHMNELTAEEIKVQIDVLKKLNLSAILYEGDFRKLGEEELAEIINMAEDYDAGSEAVNTPALPADKVFSSISILSPEKITEEVLKSILNDFKQGKYGYILRAKGIIGLETGRKIHFDYTPSDSEYETYELKTKYTGESLKEEKVIIIGCGLAKEMLRRIFTDKGN